MNLKRLNKISRRIFSEISLDIRNKDFGKVFHFLKLLPKQALFKYPKNISIEPINACNLNCEFCSSPPELIGRPLRGMKLEEFKMTIDKIKNYTHHLWLFLAGEPYLNPAFSDMVSYATKNNLNTTTSSNANLINADKAEKIVASGLDKLIVSIDAVSPDTYKQMRIGGEYQKVIDAIKFINAEKLIQKSFKPMIEIQFINTKINQHEANDFIKLAKELQVEYGIKSFGIPTWIFDKQRSDTIAEKYLPSEGKKRYENDSHLKRDFICSNVQRSFILADGTMCICCYDIKGQHKMGNIFEDEFMEVWKSKRYVNTRELMKQRKLPLCKVCGETNEL